MTSEVFICFQMYRLRVRLGLLTQREMDAVNGLLIEDEKEAGAVTEEAVKEPVVQQKAEVDDEEDDDEDTNVIVHYAGKQ